MEEAVRLQRYLPLFRACAGWTAKDFAAILDVSRQTISAWENYEAGKNVKGVKLSKVQYLAIRKVLDDEIQKDTSTEEAAQKQHIIGTLLEVLVDHPDWYTSDDVNAVLTEAKLMAPSIMKQPEKRKSVSKVWPTLLLGCGVVLSATIIALLGHDKD